MDKEDIYDTQIFPLVEEILGICKKNNIAMVCHFEIPTEKEPTLVVTSLLGDEDGIPPEINAVKNFLMKNRPILTSGMIETEVSGRSVIGDVKSAFVKKGMN